MRELVSLLRERGRLKGLARIAEYLERYEELSSLFKSAVGCEMWGAQRLWARRFVRGRSFAIVAPTGSGKTTFLLVAAIYAARQGRKTLLVFPTSALAHQAHKRLLAYAERAGVRVRAIAYHSMLTERERREALEAVERGDFDVLIVTSALLSRRFDLLSRHKFGFVAADDVDSILRATSRNVDRILKLLGVDDEALRAAAELIDRLRRLREAEIAGRAEDAERIEREIDSMRDALRRRVDELKIGTFVASGALAKARRTAKLLLFREILGFDVGGRAEGLRNVADLYVEVSSDAVAQVVQLVKRLGPGGIIYVQDRELGERIVARAREEGIPAEHLFRPRRRVLEQFERGELSILVGMASARSALVRGLDLPHVIRYVVFVGIPKYKFRVRLEEFSVHAYLTFLYNVRQALSGDAKLRADRLIGQLRRLAPYARSVQEAVKKAVEGAGLTEFERHAVSVARSAVEFAGGLLKSEDVRRAIEASAEVRLAVIDGELYVLVPDVTTYVQGSGRTSRLYAGGLSRGLSIALVDDRKVFRALQRELKLRFEEAEFRHISEVDLDAILSEVDRDRRLIRDLVSGRVTAEAGADLMKTVLVVVESPTKARTIARFFGRPSVLLVGGLPAYEVSTGSAALIIVASLGHVYELPTSLRRVDPGERETLLRWFGAFRHDGYDAGEYAVLVRGGVEFVPVYNKIWRCRGGAYVDDADVPPGCRPLDVISRLRDVAAEVDGVLIGTDPDSEGEKIAFDLYLALRPYASSVERIEFHEVTRRAILKALSSPRPVSYSLAEAQIVRRLEDRWLGFGLSKILQARYSSQNLSAGRVQTPVLGWIVRSYEESRKNAVYSVELEVDGSVLRLRVPEAAAVALRRSRQVTIRLVERSERAINPPPPYTTDEMLRDAVERLGMSAEQAMRAAQDLFESGLITYHRTDSKRVSTAGISVAREYIVRKFGEAAFMPRAWGEEAEGAHEAIRPTRPLDVDELRGLVSAGALQLAIRLARDHYRLYDLIFRRFMASQMEPGVVEIARYAIEADGAVVEVERAVGVKQQGFQAVYRVTRVEPELPTGTLSAAVRRCRKVRRLLSQAEVLALMRQRGIGRPSTYARILQVLARRYYVYVVGRRRLMVPTRRGIEVYRFLEETFGDLISEERTRVVEQYMDAVEAGRLDYERALSELFGEFSERVLPRLAPPQS
jgi:reverse gyrase